MKDNSNLDPDVDKYSELDDNGSEIAQLFDILPDKKIFTKCGKRYAGGHSKGWLEPPNFLSKREAFEWTAEGGNIGLATGRFFNGEAYVNFDIDSENALAGEARAILTSHARFVIITKHLNTNYIVPVSDKEVLELLNAYPQTLTHITDGDGDDIEIFANEFHSVIPPSEIHHAECKDTKPCDPSDGWTKYKLQAINKNAEDLSVSTAERLGELWDIEREDENQAPKTLSDYDSMDESEVPDSSPTFNIKKRWEKTPAVNHSLENRLDFILEGDWDGVEKLQRLYEQDFSDISGSQKQHIAELQIANKAGFFLYRDEKFIRLYMDMIPWETLYETYPPHRKFILERATEGPMYHEGVSFTAKGEVAGYIRAFEQTTVQDIGDTTSYEEDTIKRAVNVLEAEEMITTHYEGRKRIITNENIDNEYFVSLEKLEDKYGKLDMNPKKATREPKESNVDRTEI